MEDKKTALDQEGQSGDPLNKGFTDKVLQVIHEFPVIKREVVETGRVRIRKTVTEERVPVNLPIINESYKIETVPVNKTFDTPPAAFRYEGDVMVIPVVKEITVVQKRYEVVEELRIIRQLSETPLTQEITLMKEHIQVERTGNGNED